MSKVTATVGGVLFACAAIYGVFAMVSPAQENSTSQEREVAQAMTPQVSINDSAKVTETDDLVDRCEDTALDNGYTDGQCAFTFIDACVKTQSKTEMERIYNLQRTYGTISGSGCSTNPTTYSHSFAAKSAARDKF